LDVDIFSMIYDQGTTEKTSELEIRTQAGAESRINPRIPKLIADQSQIYMWHPCLNDGYQHRYAQSPGI
jgi:hypothetical protein